VARFFFGETPRSTARERTPVNAAQIRALWQFGEVPAFSAMPAWSYSTVRVV
jgi:hypothetical protein